MYNSIINVKNLSRSFKIHGSWFSPPETITALDNVSFQVKRGSIFGLLGQNGAGKSTTIKILTTLLLPTSGRAEIDGLDVMKDYKKIRSKINFVFGGESGVYKRMSSKDNLLYFGNLYKIEGQTLKKRIPKILKLVGLFDEENRLVETFSKGMIERLQIAKGLINNPDILFMDEPTIGLDALSVKKMHSLILDLHKQGKTIVLTTHYLKEAEDLCDTIAIINKGHLLDIGTPKSIIEKNNDSTTLESAYISIIEGDNS